MTIRTLFAQGRHVACELVESVTIDGERRDVNRAAFYTVDNATVTSAKIYDERE